MNLSSGKYTNNNCINSFTLKKDFLNKTLLLKVFIYLSLFFLFLSVLLFKPFLCEISADSYTQTQDFIDITAESAVVMDYDTKRILWEKNSDEKFYPASTTKMLTAIVAIENIPNLNETVSISKSASGRNSSFFEFKTGDKITLLDLLKAALIISHNNATIALAEYVSGSEPEFVELMNKKASKLGAYNTFFQNTNGLDTDYPEHKTTAKDLAIIANYCLKNDLFKQIVSTKKDTITINDEKIEITNTNFLLNYGYIKGVKTGFTENAGGCLVAYSEKNELNLISVILDK
ncbi:MAG: D-alanyl-D-alanine carboxypeptidase, partial [Actinobacteria bacterium]|nr:D-alanyl-D-alanine carboxypeptidase [Actinomycetota bacterium]